VFLFGDLLHCRWWICLCELLLVVCVRDCAIFSASFLALLQTCVCVSLHALVDVKLSSSDAIGSTQLCALGPVVSCLEVHRIQCMCKRCQPYLCAVSLCIALGEKKDEAKGTCMLMSTWFRGGACHKQSVPTHLN
jgi:hypothetical protein